MDKKDLKDFVTKADINGMEYHIAAIRAEMHDYVTRDDLRKELHLTELSLSKDLNNRINDTYWKLIPIVIGGMALVNGIFYVAYSIR